MAFLNDAGRYKASPREWALTQKDTGSLEFAINFSILESFDASSNSWNDWRAYNLEKTGYFYLVQRDGSVNDFCVKTLKECLGWDGSDLVALQSADLSKKIVQLTVEWEEYRGENKLKIKFMNPEDWTGISLQAPSDSALRNIASKFGAKFRAINATAKQATVPPQTKAPTIKPAKLTTPPKVMPTAAPAPADDLTPPPEIAEECAKPSKTRAWEILLHTCAGDMAQATAQWPEILKQTCSNKPVNAFTSEDWAKACELAAIPF